MKKVVYETENYKVVRTTHTSAFSRTRNGGCRISEAEVVWQIFDKNNNRVQRNHLGYIIDTYNYETRKSAIEEVNLLEQSLL